MGQFSIRISEEMHAKARILAAYKNISLNEICIKALQMYLSDWENRHQEIQLPPENCD